jgi:hypothetical protein
MLFNTGDAPLVSQNGMVTTVGYQFGQSKPAYALEGSIASAGSAIKWTRDNLGLISSSEEIGPLGKQNSGIVHGDRSCLVVNLRLIRYLSFSRKRRGQWWRIFRYSFFRIVCSLLERRCSCVYCWYYAFHNSQSHCKSNFGIYVLSIKSYLGLYEGGRIGTFELIKGRRWSIKF